MDPLETDRLRELIKYEFLYEQRRVEIERICLIAKRLLLTDSASVTLIDSDSLNFVSSARTQPYALPRRGSPCEIAIQSDGILEIPDIALDPRVSAFPPFLDPMRAPRRFYAGMALAPTPGLRLGTLCVVSAQPRRLTDDERETLACLAAIVEDEMRLHLATQTLREREFSLAKARGEAQRANQAKDVFLANMSHEIRTPLNGVIGLASSLAATGLDARQREMVELINVSGETLERLLSDVLDLTKIQAGKFDLQLETFDLNASIETAGFVVRSRAEEKGLDFAIRYGPTAHGLFIGDAIRIRQIVSNLAANAVKFTEHGTVEIVVDVDEPPSQALPATIRIEVRDSGIGFNQEVAGRLFGRFEQADGSISRTFGGTGLGLSICRALAEAMGGEINAESTLGEGATFRVALPLRRSVPVETLDREAGQASDTPHQPEAVFQGFDTEGRAIRILLAEDHPLNQRTFALILEALGVDLTIADDGQAAIDAFKAGRFDFVLMDMQMPAVDGLAATREIRAYEARVGASRTPIAMLSANAMQGHIEQSLAAGCDFHLAKPIRPDALTRGIERAMAMTNDWSRLGGETAEMAG